MCLVQVLYGRDEKHFPRGLEVVDGHFAQAGMANDTGVEKLFDGGEWFVAGHFLELAVGR